jgi:hypothetical protein
MPGKSDLFHKIKDLSQQQANNYLVERAGEAKRIRSMFGKDKTSEEIMKLTKLVKEADFESITYCTLLIF